MRTELDGFPVDELPDGSQKFPLIDLHDVGYGIFIRERVFQKNQESEIAFFLQNSISYFRKGNKHFRFLTIL